jgi:hypothetical protein
MKDEFSRHENSMYKLQLLDYIIFNMQTVIANLAVKLSPDIVWSDAIRWGICVLIIAGSLSACTPHLSSPIVPEQLHVPENFPDAYYQQAKASGEKVLHIDTNRSLVTIIVRRDGALSHLGHDHVVASHNVTGYVNITTGHADLYVPLDRLTVDEPELRKAAGFTTQPSKEAIQGTVQNMQGKVLETDRFPFALIGVQRSADDSQQLNVTISLHHAVQSFYIPAHIINTTDGTTITGEMTFKQSDFGITPFSILGGAIKVKDTLDFHFKIFAVGT